jgi:hypothetical protein
VSRLIETFDLKTKPIKCSVYKLASEFGNKTEHLIGFVFKKVHAIKNNKT